MTRAGLEPVLVRLSLITIRGKACSASTATSRSKLTRSKIVDVEQTLSQRLVQLVNGRRMECVSSASRVCIAVKSCVAIRLAVSGDEIASSQVSDSAIFKIGCVVSSMPSVSGLTRRMSRELGGCTEMPRGCSVSLGCSVAPWYSDPGRDDSACCSEAGCVGPVPATPAAGDDSGDCMAPDERVRLLTQYDALARKGVGTS